MYIKSVPLWISRLSPIARTSFTIQRCCSSKRVISPKLSDYVSPQPIDEPIVRQLIDSNYDPELCAHHRIIKRPDHYHPDDVDFNLSLTCASYNAEIPRCPYPKNFELDHDGVYVYLRCRERDGRIVTIKYWGD